MHIILGANPRKLDAWIYMLARPSESSLNECATAPHGLILGQCRASSYRKFPVPISNNLNVMFDEIALLMVVVFVL